MKAKIGLFFGSFNPIHMGHLILANHIVEYSDLDEVWFVVSPQNPFKEKRSLLPESQRLMMVNLAVEDFPKLKSSNIEFALPQPSYTVDTLTHLQEKFPEKDFTIIMGEDNIASFHKWKNYEVILEKYSIIVYPRIHDSKKIEIPKEKFTKVDAPIIGISSTQIRKIIQEKKNFRPLLPEKVFDFIDGSHLYQ